MWDYKIKNTVAVVQNIPGPRLPYPCYCIRKFKYKNRTIPAQEKTVKSGSANVLSFPKNVFCYMVI